MLAVAVNEVNADTFARARVKEFVEVKGTGCVIVPEKWLDEYLDMKVELEAARRLADPDPTVYTEAEVMAAAGLTEKDLEGWEDIEIE